MKTKSQVLPDRVVAAVDFDVRQFVDDNGIGHGRRLPLASVNGTSVLWKFSSRAVTMSTRKLEKSLLTEPME